MLSVSQNFQNAIKQISVFSSAKVTISDGTNILNLTTDDISKLEIYGSAFQNNTVLGSVAQHSFELELLGDVTKNISLNKVNIMTPQIGVLVDTSYEYVTLQDFYVTEVTYSNTSGVTKVIGADKLYALNLEFVDSNTYPMTLKSYLESVLTFCGLELENESFFNYNYVIDSQPINDYTSAKEIVSRVAEMALSFVKINKTTGKVELWDIFEDYDRPYTHEELSAFTHEELSSFTFYELAHGVSLDDEEITKSTYTELQLNDHNFGTKGINTLVLQNTQVTGENNTLIDETNVAIDGAIELTINDNPFINTEAKRLSVIESMFGKVVGFMYQPYSVEYRGFPYLEVGDLLAISKMDDSMLVSPLYETLIRFNGGLYGKVETPALSKVETEYKYTGGLTNRVKNAEILVDKVNGDITAIAQEIDNLEGRVEETELKLTPDAFNVSVRNITTDQYGETIDNIEKNFKFNTDGLEISSSENEFAVKIDESEMGFYDSGIRTAYINNSEFNIDKGRVQSSLIIGSHKIEKFNTELTLFRYIGE